MKKVFKSLVVLVAIASFAQASVGYLTGQSSKGQYIVCYYSNGGALTINSYSTCPSSHQF